MCHIVAGFHEKAKTLSFRSPLGLHAVLLGAVVLSICGAALEASAGDPGLVNLRVRPVERQITKSRVGHILTNIGVWSPDGEWVVYDTRSTPAGDQFDGSRIEVVNVRTGQIREVYESRNGAHCGVATFHPKEKRVVFILGPEQPTTAWQYCAWHRRGVIVDVEAPGRVVNLDARDITPPFTPGALRGGSHV